MLDKALSKSRRAALESAIGDMLAPIKLHTGFIIYVEGETWEARFLTPAGDGALDAGLAARFEAALAPVRDALARRQEGGGQQQPDDAWPCPFEIIAGLVAEHGFTAPELRAAAFHWLRTKGVRLGNTALAPKGWQRIKHWSSSEESMPLLRFQDALDWAATYGYDLKRMSRQRGDVSLYRPINDTVLRVQRATRQCLLTAEELEISLSEYIVALDEGTLARTDLLSRMENHSLTSYLVPARGLGQWRSAVAWLACDTGDGAASPCARLDAELARQSSGLAKAALEEFFSLSLIDIFAFSVRFALARFNLNPQRSKMLYETFTILWNSKEVRFFKGGECVQVWGRDPGSAKLDSRPELAGEALHAADAGWDSAADRAPHGFLTCSAGRHPKLTTIRLDLNHLVRARREEAMRFKHDLPFDAVEYDCYFFDADGDEVRRWAEQLEDCLRQIADEQVLRYKASDSERAETYETIAHNCKNLLTQAALGKARETLRDLMVGGKKRDERLAEVYNTLTHLTVLEGSLGLLRLNGILQRREYERLERWFTRDSLAVWEDPTQRQTVFDEYRESVVHMARSIGTALGHPFVEVDSGGRKRLYTEPCHFQPRMMIFAPLAYYRMNEPAFALMPAIAEPLLNALRYLIEKRGYGGRQWAREPIRLIIEDRREAATPHILVRVGNRCKDVHFKELSGIKMTRRLMEKTGMATLVSEEPSDDYRWVSVLLHPQKLHQKICRVAREKGRRLSAGSEVSHAWEETDRHRFE